MKTNVIFDMETQDPDDVLTLCLLSTHPDVNLRAVTVTPGSDAQIGVVRHVLHLTGRKNIPVGAYSPGYEKECVSGFHYTWLGKIRPDSPDGEGWEIMVDTLSKYPDAIGGEGVFIRANGRTYPVKPVDLLVRDTITGLKVGSNILQVYVRDAAGNEELKKSMSVEIDETGFAMYPNLASDELHVRMPEFDSDGNNINIEDYDIMISNVYGSPWLNTSLSALDFNISKLPQGVYVVRIQNRENDDLFIHRLVVNKSR